MTRAALLRLLPWSLLTLVLAAAIVRAASAPELRQIRRLPHVLAMPVTKTGSPMDTEPECLMTVTRASETEPGQAPENSEEFSPLAPRRDVLKYLASVLWLAYVAFDDGRFERARQLARDALEIAPNYLVALDLLRACDTVEQWPEAHGRLRERVAAWRDLTNPINDEMNDRPIPFAETVGTPSAAVWIAISERRNPGLEDSEDTARSLAILRMIESELLLRSAGERPSAPSDFVIASPSTILLVRDGTRYFFSSWSEAVRFAAEGETLKVFGTGTEIEQFLRFTLTLQRAGQPPSVKISTATSWTLEEVYAGVARPEITLDDVRDILKDIDTHSFDLDERNPDRY